MKNILIVAALTVVSVSAMASKARLTALGQATTTATDFQDTLVNPAKATDLGSLISIEYGPTSPSSIGGTEAEGGFLRAHGDSVYGVYLGDRSAAFDQARAQTVTGASNPTQYNPLEFLYAMKSDGRSIGASLVYQSFDDKVEPAATKVQTLGVKGGYTADNMNAFLNVGLLGTDKIDNSRDFKMDMSVRVGGEYDFNDMKVYVDYATFSGKNSQGTERKFTADQGKVGIEAKMKSDAAHFFYGVNYTGSNRKLEVGGAAQNSSSLGRFYSIPLYAGVEADVASWLVVRTSVTQSIIQTNQAASTVATLGTGMKFGKFMLDGVMATGSTGALAFDNSTTGFFTQVAGTYNF